MYIQITTKCNMRCGHCCYSCEPGKGEHMSMDTWEAALECCRDYDSTPFIGGGEPTLHPHFERIIMDAISLRTDGVGIITNGTHKRRSLALAAMVEHELVWAELSLDVHHDRSMVSQEVIDAFGTYTRDVSHDEIPVGRMVEYYDAEDLVNSPVRCPCPGLFVTPTGGIYQCGCPTSPKIGTVFTGIYDDNNARWPYECYRDIPELIEEEHIREKWEHARQSRDLVPALV